MAGLTVAELTAKLVMDTSAFLAGAKQAEGATQSMEQSLKKMGDSASALGKSLSTRLTVPIVAAFAIGTKSLLDFTKDAALTEAHIKSTGGVAGVTAQHIDGMADSLSNLSGVSRGQIATGENMLLTFTEIRNEAGAGNDIFDQTTKAILDMSQSMGSDLQTAAIQVGKALQSPVDGVTALQRVGVRLTEAQKQQVAQFVAVGDTVSAQKIILSELNTEFGGTAETIGKTFVGDVGRAQNAMKGAQRDMATALLPALTDLMKGVADAAGWFRNLGDGTKTTIAVFAALAAALGPALMIFGSIARGASSVVAIWTKMWAFGAGLWARLFGGATEAVAGTDAVVEAEVTLLGVTEQLLAVVTQIAEAFGVQAGAAEADATALAALTDAEVAAGAGGVGMAGGAEAAAAGLGAEAVAAEAAGVASLEAAGAVITLQGALGVVGIALAAAAVVYGVFHSAKKKAVDVTIDFTNALKLEGQAQHNAILQATANALATGDVRKAFEDLNLDIQSITGLPQSVRDSGFGIADAAKAVAGGKPGVDAFIQSIRDAGKASSSAAGDKILQDDATALSVALYGVVTKLGDQTAESEAAKQALTALGVTTDGTTASADGLTTAVRHVDTAMETAQKASEDMAASLLAQQGATIALRQALRDYADTAKEASNINRQLKEQSLGVAQAQQAQKDADAGVVKARRDVANANLEVARSEAAYADALTNANDKVIDSILGLQKAFSDVAWAQIQMDRAPGMQARREQDAADAVTGAYIKQRKATLDVAAAQRALDELPVTHAREVADAADKVTAAYIAQRAAYVGVTLANQALAEVSSPAHAQALADAVTTATINQTRAHDGIAIAQRKASEAGKELAATQKEIRQVVAGNTTHLSDFAKTLQSSYAEALDATKRFKADTAISLSDLAKNLEANLADFASWQANLQKLAAGGHQGLAQELAKMGPSAAMAVAQAVNATGPELDRLQDLYAQKTKFEAPTFAVKQAKGMGDSGIDKDYLDGLRKQEKDQADAKKEAQQGVTEATIAARAADDSVTKALQDQANLYIDIQAKADAVTTAVLATNAAANGITDALKAQQDLATGPNSLEAQTQALTDNLTAAQLALVQSGYGVADAVQAQLDTMAKLGPYEDLGVVASRGLQSANEALNGVTQGLNAALQGQSDLMQRIGPTLDPITQATDDLAAANSSLASALNAQTGAGIAYGKTMDGVKSKTDLTAISIDNLNSKANQLLTTIYNNAVSSEARLIAIATHGAVTDVSLATEQQKHDALIQALNETLATIPAGAIHDQLATFINSVMGKEMGGPVLKGKPYLVGEKRPEVFVPDRAGTIVPSVDKFMAQSMTVPQMSKVPSTPFLPQAPKVPMPAVPPIVLPKQPAPAVNVYVPKPAPQPPPQSGDTYYSVALHVAGSVLTDRDLVNVLHRGLLEKQRQSGNLGFEGA